ncbi:MAG: cyclase family protein [Deltaproteobacteria bacterium]|nr:cyclase family protein [Deltaproteobacteria bacterium]
MACGQSGPIADPEGASTANVAPSFDASSLDVLADARVIDLSYGYGDETLYWPTSPSDFEKQELAYGDTEGGYFYSSNAICTPEHGGTHLDAPIHFAAGAQTADQIPLRRLIAPAVVIDISDHSEADPDYRLTVQDVEQWEASHGRVPPGAIVLLRTGWGDRWPDRLRYFGDDTPGDASNLHFPSYGEAAAKLLVEQRQVAVLGVDTASIDYGPSRDFLVHRVASEANVPGLENVARLEEVPATGAWVIALPMKIVGGSGGPVRIAALVPAGE